MHMLHMCIAYHIVLSCIVYLRISQTLESPFNEANKLGPLPWICHPTPQSSNHPAPNGTLGRVAGGCTAIPARSTKSNPNLHALKRQISHLLRAALKATTCQVIGQSFWIPVDHRADRSSNCTRDSGTLK